MIRTGRVRRIRSRGSLEDDSSQSRNHSKPNHTQSSSLVNTMPQKVPRCNNQGNKSIPPSNRQFQLKNSSGVISSSESDDEEYIHLSRLIRSRDHSGYETGESSDRNLRSRMPLKTQQNSEPSTFQQSLDSDSSSNDSVLSPQMVKNLKRRRPLSPSSSSSTSDSGVPAVSKRPIKRMRLISSSEGSCSEFSSDENNQTQNPNVNSVSLDKDTACGSQYERNFNQENSRVSVPPGTSTHSLSGRRLLEEESESESDPISINHSIRGRRIRVIESEEDTDSPEEHVTRNSRVSSFQEVAQSINSLFGSRNLRRRPRRNVPLLQRSVGNIWRVTTQSEESEDDVISPSNARRVSGRRNPVVESGNDSESDTANNNEMPINQAVPSIVTDVSNLGRISVNYNERSSVQVLNSGSGRRNMSVDQSEGEYSSSDSDIRPRALSNRIIPIFQSDDSSSSFSSSTDSDDSIPIRNPRLRRNRQIPVVDDNEDTADHKVQNDNSSDTDAESEKCPICLAGFKLQEVGKPKSCDHNFCFSCIKEWATKNNTCPVDRKVFDGIIVYDKIDGKTTHELPVETANPQNIFEVDFGSIEDIVAELFTDSDAGSSWYFDDSDGDGPEELCSVCGSSNQPHRMISCDMCNTVCHLGCLNPPLRDFPSFGWLCSYCEFYDTDSS